MTSCRAGSRRQVMSPIWVRPAAVAMGMAALRRLVVRRDTRTARNVLIELAEERTGAKECRATPGNRGVYVLRRIRQNRAEFTFISLWDSFDAIRRFAGEDYEKAHYYPEDRDFLVELEPFVEHYDVLDAPAL